MQLLHARYAKATPHLNTRSHIVVFGPGRAVTEIHSE